MTLKAAALLALVGTALMMVLSVWRFVINLINLLHDAVAPAVVLSSFIVAFAWLSLAVFLYYFHRAQARG